MSTSNSIRRAVRFALVTSATAVIAANAVAVQAADDTISEVVVTGSRIQRQDYESASPVVTLGEDAFQKSATLSVETLLNSLPQFVPSITNTTNNPSNGGQANVELRGLGTNRTLVLLDGKRVVPANGTGVVDLNLFPPSLIKNVEIITGGASAAYGSDAIAGVVNFKTKDLEGIEVDTNYGETDESDGTEYQISISGGLKFAEGRGKVVANLSYADREAVFAQSRDFSRIGLGFDGSGFVPAGSGTIEEGSLTIAASQAAVDQVFARYGVPAGTVTGRGFGFNNDGTLFSLGDGMTANSVRNFRGTIDDTFNDAQFTYNFAPTNYLQLPLERKSAFARGSFEITPAAEVYVQGIWAQYDANTQLAPTPGTTLFVPTTNPFISADFAQLLASRANPTAPLSFNKRLTEIGPRFENNEFEVYQVLGGLRGDLFGTSWKYDGYGSYGKTTIDNLQMGSISRSRVEQLTFAADGGMALCGGFNPFGKGTISQGCADFITVDALNKTEVEQTIAEITFSGSVMELPAGPLQTAVGVFYKKDEFSFIADDALRATSIDPLGRSRADVAGFNATDNTVGDTDSTEYYVEALIPILRDKPGAQKLEVTLGYRLADYSTVGDVNSYKTEFTYQPVTPVTVRGSYQRAVRAPNISELFQPQVTNFPAINPPDPCSTNSAFRTGADAAAVRSLCLAQGLPAGLIDSFTFPNQQVQGLSGGNPNLEEETADTYTLGVVFRSPFDNPLLSNFQVSVDFYKITIEDAIQPITADTFVDRCYSRQSNPNLSADNFFCNFFQRDSVDGTIVNAAELQQNIGAIETSGVDVQVDWALDVGPGRLGFNAIGSWLRKYDEQNLPGDPFDNLVDTVGNQVGTARPRWKWTFNTVYDFSNGIGLNARARYINTLSDENVRDFEIPSVTYIDVGASYAFPASVMDGLTLRLGVTNVGDKDPQIYPSSIQSNTDPSSYDVLGRRYFLSANYRFQ